MDKRVDIRTPETRVVDYTTQVPFYRSLTIIEHTLVTNDEFTPDTGTGKPSMFIPIAGNGAWYRLTADGVHAPSFVGFKKHSASGDWVSTIDTLNIISFLYDGADYWYTIGQEI